MSEFTERKALKLLGKIRRGNMTQEQFKACLDDWGRFAEHNGVPCVGCEGSPVSPNDPCEVCGKTATS